MAINNRAQEIQEITQHAMKDDVHTTYVNWVNAMGSYNSCHMPQDSTVTGFEDDFLEATEELSDVLDDCADQALDYNAFKEIHPYLSSIQKTIGMLENFEHSEPLSSGLEKLTTMVVSMYQGIVDPAPKMDKPTLHPVLSGKLPQPYVQ